jgi:CTP:phosphocholine cytidylyltransferase-like protein
MEGATMTGLSNYTANTAETISTLDEATYGDLDTINVFWDRVTQRMEICDIAYTRVS